MSKTKDSVQRMGQEIERLERSRRSLRNILKETRQRDPEYWRSLYRRADEGRKRVVFQLRLALAMNQRLLKLTASEIQGRDEAEAKLEKVAHLARRHAAGHGASWPLADEILAVIHGASGARLSA